MLACVLSDLDTTGALLVFNVGDRASFEEMKNKHLLKVGCGPPRPREVVKDGEWMFSMHNCDAPRWPYVLCGNHTRYQGQRMLPRQVSTEEAEELARERGLRYCECDINDIPSVCSAFLMVIWLMVDEAERSSEGSR